MHLNAASWSWEAASGLIGGACAGECRERGGGEGGGSARKELGINLLRREAM